MKLPARKHENKVITFPIRNRFYTSLKNVVREYAKQCALYWKPISTVPKLDIKDDHNHKLKIDNLGKWIFGTPGYAGNVTFCSFDEKLTVIIPDGIPEVEQLLTEAMHRIC